jgi:hypothetical protein
VADTSDDVTHHPEGVSDKDLAYQAKVQQRIVTGQDPSRASAVVLFANHMTELGQKFSFVGAGSFRYQCGCVVEFTTEALISVCEGHR